ncbi:MAG: hypothetical protein HUK24_07080 [Sphaerochaetaceae bacterium]|nr:hypothetical protein [Sphaerochaetaceae bacterium]
MYGGRKFILKEVTPEDVFADDYQLIEYERQKLKHEQEENKRIHQIASEKLMK